MFITIIIETCQILSNKINVSMKLLEIMFHHNHHHFDASKHNNCQKSGNKLVINLDVLLTMSKMWK